MIVWSVAIARYPENNGLRNYAIVMLSNSVFVLFCALFSLEGLYALFSGPFSIGVFVVVILGFGWFKDVTGYSIFEMYGLTHNYWTTLPFLESCVYFHLWFMLVIFCVAAVLIGIAIFMMFASCCGRATVNIETADGTTYSNQSSSERVTQVLSTIVPIGGMSSMFKRAQDWASKDEECSICTEKFNEDTVKLNCNHYFHQHCLKEWIEKQELATKTCPICRKPFAESETVIEIVVPAASATP
ncbi:hypothetical protein EDD86DRAFT_205178 [Gorgonomyces haynaldii]|nr:hypothetical protein EDD86DRAFT_205178 [Gorgonomyces haynaldii]